MSNHLDLAELNIVQYNVQILDTPVSDSDNIAAADDVGEEEVTRSVTMVNKEGQKYRCSLPLITPEQETRAEDDQTEMPDIAQLLAPLEDAPCLYKTKDWWTYEVCFKRHVRQYHVENERPVGEIMVLGVHDAIKDNYDDINKTTTFLPQWYTNGTNCDLTGSPRKTELRFICNEAALQDFIGDIFEPQSCEYTIVIHTSRLCSLPWLRPAAEPTPLPITCHPLLSRHQMEKYQSYLEKKKLVDELELQRKQSKKLSDQAAVVNDVGNLDQLLSSLGDNMAETLVTEITSLLGTAVSGETAAGGIKVIDLRDKETKPDDESEKVEDWNIIHEPGSQPNKDLEELISERNQLWRAIHENKKLIKKYSSQLRDTNTFLANERLEQSNDNTVEKLETQQKTIENLLTKTSEALIELESKSKDVAQKIISTQNKIRINIEKELKTWITRLTEMENLYIDDSNIHDLLMEMSIDYKKTTNEWLHKIDDYFGVASKLVGDKYDSDKMSKHHQYLMFWDQYLPTREEVMLHMAEQAELEFDVFDDDDVGKTAKFRDVIKENVRQAIHLNLDLN